MTRWLHAIWISGQGVWSFGEPTEERMRSMPGTRKGRLRQVAAAALTTTVLALALEACGKGGSYGATATDAGVTQQPAAATQGPGVTQGPPAATQQPAAPTQPPAAATPKPATPGDGYGY
jgi:hypothetical protein